MQREPHDSRDESHHRLRLFAYRVRVRETTKYLWGSSGIEQNSSATSPLVLHLHNDVFGNVVTFGTASNGTPGPAIGTLQPGEAFSIPLQNISGVYATATPYSTVSCFVRNAP